MGGPLICVIEDEEAIAAAVAARLRAEGFAVEVAADGPAGVALCERLLPDLVVLDLLLPGMEGLEVCRRVQRSRPVPVLMLTALDAETDVLVGLGVGADDYMTKPFSMRELVARVRALLRRVERRPPAGETLRVGELELDPAERRVRVAGAAVELTPTEFELLAVLAARPGTVHTREQLLAEVWGWRDGSGTRTVDSHVVIVATVAATVAILALGSELGLAVELRVALRRRARPRAGPGPGSRDDLPVARDGGRRLGDGARRLRAARHRQLSRRGRRARARLQRDGRRPRRRRAHAPRPRRQRLA